jgi:putative endopeptidase
MAEAELFLMCGSLVLAASVFIAACSGQQSSRAPASESDQSAGGVDLAGMDSSVKPGDDFFRYANGSWLAVTEIPADRSSYGLDARLAEQALLQTRSLLEEASKGAAPVGSDERKIGDYYAAFLDENTIEAHGLEPLKSQLDAISAISDRRSLAEAIAQTVRADVDPLNATNFHTHHLFGIWVAQDFNQPTRCAPYVLQGGIGMPDREYYVSSSPRMADIRAKYKEHIAAVLKLAKNSNAENRAAGIFDLETKIAQVHWSRAESFDVHKANNLWKREDFRSKAPGMDWQLFFNAAGLENRSEFIVWQPSALAGEARLVGSEPLEIWKDYLTYQLLDDWSGVLPKAFVEERFAFYAKVLSGTPQLRERWKRGVDAANHAMGDAVGRLYVQHYFPSEAKAKAEAMVAKLIEAFGRRIDNLTWMTSETRAKAKEKLATLKVGVGYPDKWIDYSGLEIQLDNAFGNAFQAELYEYRRSLAKLDQPVDRSEWWMTPQTVNAVNLPIQNALNFPAAILQAPYFEPKAEASDNFGAIGSVIGHEISHSFDDQGSQFDATGRLANWWTPADLAHFKEAANRLVAQYNAYHPFSDLAVNGQQTLSENIADVAGISVAYDGYRLALGGQPAPVRQGFNGDQQFFISFVQSWRTKFREPLLRQMIVTDGHSPAEYRADAVRNIDAWYDAFGVKPGEALYLPPGDRVRIW